MNCAEFAAKIQRFQPGAGTPDIARMLTLICNVVDDLDALRDDEQFLDAWDESSLRLQAATDQHAAVTEELETLADCDPSEFTVDQIWTLIRSIKVQNQLLTLYVGNALGEQSES